MEKVVAFRFLSSSVIWLDLIRYIIAEEAPFLPHYHTSVVTADSQMKLETTMGCRIWVTLLTGRIIALQE